MTVAISISPTQDDLQTALGNFLLSILPASVGVYGAQDNQTPEPSQTSFVIMTPISFERLSTNVHAQEDVTFTASISGTIMTVSAITPLGDGSSGTIQVGATVFGATVAVNTAITGQTSGTPGGVGTYTVSASQTLSSSALAAGLMLVEMDSIVTVQCDCHSADYSASSFAQTISQMIRDPYAADFFSGLAAPQDQIAPLYADGASKRPFVNDQNQTEWRWVVDVKLQVNQTVSVPQQYYETPLVVLQLAGGGFFPP